MRPKELREQPHSEVNTAGEGSNKNNRQDSTLQNSTDKNSQPTELVLRVKLEDCSLNPDYGFIFSAIAEGNFERVLQYCEEKSIIKNQSDAQEQYLRGLAYLLSNRFNQALETFERCLDAGYESEYLLFNTGNALRSLGHAESALTHFDRALQIEPQFPECQHNRALALADLEHYEEAITALRLLLVQTPNYYLAAFSLGNLLRSAGQHDNAIRAYQEAIAHRPSHVDAYNNKGLCHAALGDHPNAISSYRLGLSIKPTDVNCLQNLAQALISIKDHGEAIHEYKRLLALSLTESQLAGTVQSYLTALLELEQHEQAREFIASQPDPIIRDLYTLHLLPVIYDTAAHVQETRKSYIACLSRLQQATQNIKVDDPLTPRLYCHAWLLTSFYLAYQMEDDRELQIALSSWLTSILRLDLEEFTKRTNTSRSNGKYRIGFVSPNLRNHNGCFWALPFFRAVAESGKVDLFAYNLGEDSDYVTEQFASLGLLRQLPLSAATAQQVFTTIREDSLDLLFFTDVGMHPASKVASLMRLAGHQAVGWGHPVTTGSPNMDSYISGEGMETPDSQTFYSEKLVLLPRTGICYDPPLIEDVELDLRTHYGLPEDRPVLLSLQSSFKYHPKHDPLYAELSSLNPEAFIVLVGHMGNKTINQVLFARMARSYNEKGLDIHEHLCILPRLPYHHYVGLFGIAHHALDTPDWNGGNSSFQAFAQACPVVTLPGRFMRGRHTISMLEVMELEELIATSESDYLQISTRLLREPQFHQNIKDLIKERAHRLFRDEGIARAFRDWALATCASVREEETQTIQSQKEQS